MVSGLGFVCAVSGSMSCCDIDFLRLVVAIAGLLWVMLAFAWGGGVVRITLLVLWV